ncbi:MAG: DUF2285 domain-containing protein [Mesorhizobium sp.]|uniref:hypothetical protein n=1 Tax=Mesorhizobium sp. TaxID=1871066 RepID=UPI000FEA7792|nr:hypothetical protein [Mesorhizobium sp.]RWK50346.1 MAG: DUF2285 domain-containing protein [Mesorhizobium sp.]TIP41102.1 MAG: DUF2285 domain-containing protein [Mesorhizobium sp.]TJW72158.1 MAG: DUF2285 domain-containing protein [Mesorhizobium sp.]
MPKMPLNAQFADTAPTSSAPTAYDEHCMLTYMRLLDASADGADWREVAHSVLHIDPEQEPERAFRAWATHLARARWMTGNACWHRSSR